MDAYRKLGDFQAPEAAVNELDVVVAGKAKFLPCLVPMRPVVVLLAAMLFQYLIRSPLHCLTASSLLPLHLPLVPDNVIPPQGAKRACHTGAVPAVWTRAIKDPP